MHASTFKYLQPTDEQIKAMAIVREAAAVFGEVIVGHVPDGPDKTYLMRKHREVAMWADAAITRQSDGAPR